jgi:hypothetical protein
VAPGGARPREGVVTGDGAVAVDAQDLAQERVPVPRGVVAPGTAPAGVVAAAVADAHIQHPVLAELEVAAVVVPRRRRDVVDQHDLAVEGVA